MKQLAICLLAALLACKNVPQSQVTLLTLESGTTASFRALSVVDEDIAWVSGSAGTVLKTIDSGKDWLNVSRGVPDSLDFRDIEAFSENDAVILSAGSPGLVLQTSDGGQTWRTAYRDDRTNIFFDAMGFWDRQNGLAFGDAIDGKLEIIMTTDGGRSWFQLPEKQRPQAGEGEGGFAASGTCLFTLGDSSAWIALGLPKSRILVSHDRAMTWNSYPTPMAQETGSAGIFSIGFTNSLNGLAVGGDYRNRSATEKLLARTLDGGQTWNLIEKSYLNGQKSAITPIPGTEKWLATGATGVNLSLDHGTQWSLLDTAGYYTIQMANKRIGYLSGANGRLAKIIFAD